MIGSRSTGQVRSAGSDWREDLAVTLPDLYLIGAPKAGTTAIADWLARHPDVFWSTPKEPFYWAADYPGMRAHYGFENRAAYERLFTSERAGQARVRGEGSTTYLYSQDAVPAIVDAVPGAKFIVCLRDPVDLLVSYHRTQVVALNENEPDFALAWHRSLDGRLPQTRFLDPKLVDYPMVGSLGQAVARLREHVPDDRVHLVLFDDLVAHPDAIWDALVGFADLDPAVRPALETKNRSNKMFRHQALYRLTHRPPVALQRPMRRLRQWSRTTSMPGVRVAKRRMWQAAPRPHAGVEIRQQVGYYLRADIDLLADLVGRNLSHWATMPDDGGCAGS